MGITAADNVTLVIFPNKISLFKVSYYIKSVTIAKHSSHLSLIQHIVVEVMGIGNIVLRVGIELMNLAFWVMMLTITQPRIPAGTTEPTPTCRCGSLP